MTKEFTLSYYLTNNGDGSASAVFCKTFKEAEDSSQAEEGWGENTASDVFLKLEDGKLYFEGRESEPPFKRIWVEIPQ